MPSTLDTRFKTHSRRAKELIAEHLDFGIQHGSIRGRSVEVARRVIQQVIRKLLNHKQIADEEREAIRERWRGYL